MAVETLIRQLLEAGVHFGHQTKRWNPKMKEFIFGERSDIYIIDLQQTAQCLKTACEFLKTLTASGGLVLFVGTKKQAREIVGSEAARCGMFYVNERWLGGTLTNFATIRKSAKHLQELEALRAPENAASLTKKELASLDKDIARLKKKLSGIVQMDSLPGALVVVDPKKEETAVREARRLELPVVALLDTNCDPAGIGYPIPGNDDALKSIRFIIAMLADNALEGREKYKQLSITQKEKKEKGEEEVKDSLVKEAVLEIAEPIIEDIEKKIKEPQEPLIHRKPPKVEGRKK